MTFWHDPTLEPKRSYRFQLIVAGGDEELTHYMIKKVNRPQFEVTESEHKYLNHTFYYPGKMQWSEVSFTITDALTPNAARRLMSILEASGYKAPIGSVAGIDDAQTISKSKSRDALGSVKIQQLSADPSSNTDILEQWTLHNAWIKGVNFGELDYDGEDLMNIEVTLRYDYASLDVLKGQNGEPTGILPSNAPRT